MLTVERLWAWLITDREGGERISVTHNDETGAITPMMGGHIDPHSLDAMAQELSSETGCTMRLVVFELASTLRTIEPKP